MSVRLYTSPDGWKAARIKWPGFKPDWLEAKSWEELDGLVNQYVEKMRQQQNKKAVAPVARKAGTIISEYTKARSQASVPLTGAMQTVPLRSSGE